jgi:hypothetical protein
MTIKNFHEIFALEVAAISRRRKTHGRPPIVLEEEDRERDGTPVMRPQPGSNVVGLALSGGGIRSAAFCLGAMQALATDKRKLIDKIDYLSSVSGGGYIGISMTAAMSTGMAGTFPFASELRTGEVPGVQHIRDHSNYLFPQGLLNLFSNIVVYLRGIFANVVLLLPWLVLAAAFTIWANPNSTALEQTKIGDYLVHLPIPVHHFGLTLYSLLAFVILLASWALWRSTPWRRDVSDTGFSARVFGGLLVGILAIAFCELQPSLLDGMFKLAHSPGGEITETVSSWLKRVTAIFAAIGTIVGFLGRFLSDVLKRNTEKPGFSAAATRITIKLAMYVAGAGVPLALWVAYLYLSFWGIADWAGTTCTDPAPWLTTLAGEMPFGRGAFAGKVPFGRGTIAGAYFMVGALMFVISWLLSPNSNSLHQFYRDRLSKAFLFDPSRRQAARASPRPAGATDAERDAASRNSDLEPLDTLRISELRPDLAPYHLSMRL